MKEDDYVLRNCTKNPGHQNFVDVSKFKMTDIPYNHQSNELYDLINSTSLLTVRLRIETKKTCHYGTGTILHVDMTEKQGLCPCGLCAKSKKPSQEFWKVYILTASHLIADKQNVKMIIADLFYDDSMSKDKVQHLYELSDGKSFSEQDSCSITFASHDGALVNSLDKYIKNYKAMSESLFYKYEDDRNVDRLIFIISHPHGSFKKISFGHLVPSKQTKQKRELSIVLEAQLTNVEVQVCYPDGEVSNKNIWQLDDNVRKTKEWLLQEGGIHSDDTETFRLYLKFSCNNLKVMDDNIKIRNYLSDLVEAECIFLEKDTLG